MTNPSIIDSESEERLLCLRFFIWLDWYFGRVMLPLMSYSNKPAMALGSRDGGGKASRWVLRCLGPIYTIIDRALMCEIILYAVL